MMRAAVLAVACLIAVVQCFPKAAIFSQTNELDTNIGNEVIVLIHDDEDRLYVSGRYPTWDFLRSGNMTKGSGPASTGLPEDPLFSQYSVVARSDNVYVVNAGSNDWSVLHIEDNGVLGPARTTGSQGFFPVSIDACGDWVLVANQGLGGNLAGFKRQRDGSFDNTFVSDFGSLTATNTGLFGVSQVSFIRDCTQAVVLLKEGPSADARFWVYNFNPLFGLASAPVQTTVEPLTFAFSVVEVDDEDQDDVWLLTSNAQSASASQYAVWRNGSITTSTAAVANSQTATCWNAVDGSGHLFTANTAADTISSYNFTTEGELRLLSAVAASGPGSVIDVSVWGNFLYALWPRAGVVRVYVINADGSLTVAGDGIGLDLAPGAANVGLYAYGLSDPNASPASFLAPSFLFILALLKAFF